MKVRETEENGILLRQTTTICPPPETEIDTEQFHTYNRERSENLPFMGGDSNPERGGQKRCLPEQVSATHKRRNNRERDALKPEVTTLSKLPQPETQHQYQQKQSLSDNSNTMLLLCAWPTKQFRSLQYQNGSTQRTDINILENSLRKHCR